MLMGLGGVKGRAKVPAFFNFPISYLEKKVDFFVSRR